MAMNPDNLPCGPGIPLPKGPNDARYVENIMEHAFLSEVLQHCWFIRHHPVEVIRPDVDAGGYDLVLEANRRVRHIQLKSRWRRATGRKDLKINPRLLVHPDPCVVWILWQADPATCRVTLQYKYSDPKVAKWVKPMPRAATFELKWADFLPSFRDTPPFLDTPALVDQLFGPAASL